MSKPICYNLISPWGWWTDICHMPFVFFCEQEQPTLQQKHRHKIPEAFFSIERAIRTSTLRYKQSVIFFPATLHVVNLSLTPRYVALDRATIWFKEHADSVLLFRPVTALTLRFPTDGPLRLWSLASTWSRSDGAPVILKPGSFGLNVFMRKDVGNLQETWTSLQD